jgi:drug/metabolite transporter (DMT)-like permease
MLVEPVGGFVLAAMVLNQQITLAEVAGGLVVLLSGVLVQRHRTGIGPTRLNTTGGRPAGE